MPGSYAGGGGGLESGGPNPYDGTQDFAETGVTVSTTTFSEVDSGSIQMPPSKTGTGATDGGTYNNTSGPGNLGWVINPNDDLSHIDVTLDSENEALNSTAYILDPSDGSILTSKSVDLQPGDTFTFEYVLLSGTDYAVTIDAGSSSNEQPAGSNGSLVDQVDGYQDGTGANPCCWSQILGRKQPTSAGPVTIEWGTPPVDLYAWDVATFTQTKDSETVKVYVEYSDDGGSTWNRANGGSPIGRNYDLTGDPDISPTSDVRLAATFSRSDGTNNPTLDSAFRSYYL